MDARSRTSAERSGEPDRARVEGQSEVEVETGPNRDGYAATLVELLGSDWVAELARTPARVDSEHYLGLVVRLVSLVDTASDRRAVVLECSKLLRTTGKDSHGLEQAFDAGDFSAADYLSLGEVSSAGRAVRDFLRVEQRPPNPYAAAPTVHLSGPRIGMYIDGCRDLLGENVFGRLETHIAHCEPCQGAVAHRRASERAGYSHQ